MAHLSILPDDELLRQLDRLADADKLQKKMLTAGAPPLMEAVKRRLMTHRKTGALVAAIGYGKPKRAKRSKRWYILIGPTEGYDPKTGVPHGRKMMSLEYGTSHQTATPFLSAARRDAEGAALQAMQEAFDQEVSE